MIVFLIAVGLAAVVFALVTWTFSIVAAVLPTLVALPLAYFLLARQIGKKFESSMIDVQSHLQRGKFDQGIAALEAIKKRFGRWQFFTQSALDGQIGSIYFMRQDFERARPFLERSFVRHWIAKGMLGTLYFRKKEFKKMDETFEYALKYSSKQGLLWGVWAYCHWRAGHTEKAVEILARGQKKLGEADPRLTANLLHLQNEKKMKMNGYGEQWYQFQLEMPRAVRQMRSQQVRYVNR